jgi:hypothetical protein
MPRGSMPGERRGGRSRATPNQRTILADRMMAVLAGCAMATPKQLLSKLVNDPELPADIRMAIAPKAFPGRTGGGQPARRAMSEIRTTDRTQRRRLSRSASRAGEPRAIEAPFAASAPVATMSHAARDALLGIVSDASAPTKARRKAAAKLAAHFLPKKPVSKRWRFAADECGFAINGEIAREYHAVDFELERLKRHPSRDFPEIAQMIGKLQARIDAIRQRLECPCPTRYGNTEISEDMIRLNTLADKRAAGIALSRGEDAEEAHRKARFDCYVRGPEQAARHYRRDLEGTDLRLRKGRFFKVEVTAPLSRKQRSDLALLRWLYPRPNSKSHLSAEAEAEAEADAEPWNRHPFRDEEPAADGNWYPQDSILRPASADEPEFVEYADGPPYCIHIPGQPPIFTHEPPINFSSDKSEPTQS